MHNDVPQTTRRQFLRTLAGAAAGAGVAALAGPAARSARAMAAGSKADSLGDSAKKLNFVIVLIDDMGWTDLGCFGSTYYDTPRIDKFCADSMKFTNGYAACAVCSPTRAAVMTGRYPARVGITDWIRARFQGGRSGPNDGHERPAYAPAKASKKVICPQNPFWMKLSEITIPEMLKPAGYTSCHIGKWHLGPDPYYPDKQGFDYNIGGCDLGQPMNYFDPYTAKRLPGGIPTLPPRKKGEYLTDRETYEAVNFITKHKDKPFFLYMAHYAVHTPLMSKPDLKAKYEAKPKTNQKNPTYGGMVESVDISTGKILDAIDKLGLADNTVVIFTSDNGGLMGPTNNAPLREGKGWPYEGGIRVPLIIRWPGLTRPGTSSDEPVCSIDYFPTICQAAGVGLPKGVVIDGIDIRPALKVGGKLDRKNLYWHFPHYRNTQPYSIVRSGDWKLIKRYDGREFELFNLAKDLGEKNDLSDKLPEKVKELDALLTAWLKDAGAKLPKPNPAYNAHARSKPFVEPLYD